VQIQVWVIASNKIFGKTKVEPHRTVDTKIPGKVKLSKIIERETPNSELVIRPRLVKEALPSYFTNNRWNKREMLDIPPLFSRI